MIAYQVEKLIKSAPPFLSLMGLMQKGWLGRMGSDGVVENLRLIRSFS